MDNITLSPILKAKLKQKLLKGIPMQQLIFKHISQTFEDYDLFLFDLWGVVFDGDKVYPGVVESINSILKQKKVIFLSNAPRPSFAMKNRLESWGFKNITEEMIITSGDVARELMLEEAKKLKQEKLKIYHLGDDRNDEILDEFDHIITYDYKEADVVLLSLHRDENENIREFDDLLQKIAKQDKILTICANPDISTPQGNITKYCAGYFAQIIEKNGGKVIYTGKPQNVIYQNVFKKVGDIPKKRILMIGDTFETDIIGAQNAGIDSALVLTGNAYKLHSNYKSMEDKLQSLTKKAKELSIFPTFVTELV